MGFENAGIEDDIAINGTLFQRIVIFFMLEKLFFHHAGLKLQKTKSVSYSPHPHDQHLMHVFCDVISEGHPPICIPSVEGFKFSGKWFGNKDFVKRKIEIQISEKIQEISDL